MRTGRRTRMRTTQPAWAAVTPANVGAAQQASIPFSQARAQTCAHTHAYRLHLQLLQISKVFTVTNPECIFLCPVSVCCGGHSTPITSGIDDLTDLNNIAVQEIMKRLPLLYLHGHLTVLSFCPLVLTITLCCSSDWVKERETIEWTHEGRKGDKDWMTGLNKTR